MARSQGLLKAALHVYITLVGAHGELENSLHNLNSFKVKMAVCWVNFYQTTRCYNPEDSHLHTHHCENLKSYLVLKLHAVRL
jgi:hypothetical protein